MAVHPTTGQSPWGRKAGYLVAVILNTAVLFLVNVRPGWREVPFLTDSLAGILWLIKLSALSNALINAVYLWRDPAWFKSVAQIGVSVLGLTAAIAMLQVFPFDFSAYSFNWAVVTRVLLWLAVFGSVVAIVTELAHLTKGGVSAADRSHSLPRR